MKKEKKTQKKNKRGGGWGMAAWRKEKGRELGFDLGTKKKIKKKE